MNLYKATFIIEIKDEKEERNYSSFVLAKDIEDAMKVLREDMSAHKVISFTNIDLIFEEIENVVGWPGNG